MTRPEPERLVVADAAHWRAWLDENEESCDGVQLVLAKRGTTEPTSLTYAQALEEALCSGWIDGRKNSLDQATFLQHFTPRRARSMWSQRNIEIVAGLIAGGRMRTRGHAEIHRAKNDGRWDRAYPGQASAQAPPDLLAALEANPAASAAFDALGGSARYSVLHPVLTAANEKTRATRIARAIDKLQAG